MSDAIKHECGIAMIRLRKPLEYYYEKYGTPTYGMNKLYLLMEKQHNRGQDGAGVANIKLDIQPGKKFFSRYRSIDAKPIESIFKKISSQFAEIQEKKPENYLNPDWMKNNCDFTGELWLGHLRYGTHGGNSIDNCHPMLRGSNWRSRNLVVAGNFNMTNVEELYQKLLDLGQHPVAKVDTITVMEKIGHFLDDENQKIFNQYRGSMNNVEITQKIEEELDLGEVLSRSCKDFDGGYAMAGMTGFGSAFVARDPAGIRPAFYYANEEVVVIASEKPAIKTAFGADYDEIKELDPGHAIIIEKNGDFRFKQFTTPLEKKPCSFERIYFSRGSDPDIYKERKELGKLLIPKILEKVNHNLCDTVFSYIPNTAETSFIGMIEGINEYLVDLRKEVIKTGDQVKIDEVLSLQARVEKLVIKDAKLRTFITDDEHRDDLVAHVYDTTYEIVKKKVDTLVVIDDSIVRGTTLEKSILKMLDRLEPKKIIIVSSAPQIRFPDCYGIDMSKMRSFVAFRAILELLKDTNQESLLEEVYHKCKEAVKKNSTVNYVKEIYSKFTYEQISDKIAEIVTPDQMEAQVEVIYQTVEDLHVACPNNSGDWYFTGDYPTVGGNRVVNQSFINFYEGNDHLRAY
ncbi:amidophosphoribosyltransferase [Aureibacter tunicatorum]|uniref:Amidophosphoribosyltransferase n=1 Tax=Aureibacter tunicatorum TaxID=866807 RepID=A0AAE3XJS7_9BACT|nr:amidophosphoribosyltransferase [Aureibacter tunicatorum]MDR6239061.1 amidophosphoribosyltransferase [Aureibacter tunicatorum]BDD05013.1 amidophosphoribosyltransferase [Aureibacter tunicatorum]